MITEEQAAQIIELLTRIADGSKPSEGIESIASSLDTLITQLDSRIDNLQDTLDQIEESVGQIVESQYDGSGGGP